MLLEAVNWKTSITVDRWMTNLEKLPRSANPGNIETILEDLEETRARHGRLQ
jgi:hypothetical protein